MLFRSDGARGKKIDRSRRGNTKNRDRKRVREKNERRRESERECMKERLAVERRAEGDSGRYCSIVCGVPQITL